MRFGWAAKVSLGTILPVLLGMGAFVLLTLDAVSEKARANAVSELRREVQLLAEHLPAGADLAGPAKVGAFRVTVVDEAGKVRTDSEADPATMENHGTRPEIVAAWKGGVGVEQRYSRTVGRSLLYAAARMQTAPLVVRVARDVSALEEELAASARLFWLVAGGVASISVLFALMLARSVTRPVHLLTAAAAAWTRGERASVLPKGDDELARLSGAFNTMTEKLDQALTDARAEAARLETLLGGMSEGVLAVDAGERIAFLNAAARKILGIEGEARGTRLYEQIREPHVLGLVQSAASRKAPVEAEISQEGPPRRLVQIYAAPAGDDVIVVLRDVSRMRRLERMRTDFVSNVSHELRTPLATIAAAVETLRDEDARTDPETADRFVDMLERNVSRLEALLDDILALSRFESRPETLQRVPLDLASLSRSAADDLRDRAERGSVELTVTGGERVPVRGDAEALRRIVDNLIVNAITYTPAGGRVQVDIFPEGEQATLRVQDTGIGIPPQEQERIFERFYRVDKSRSRSAGGTGLGLAIVKHAVGFHGGDIEVESRPGHGTTFTVHLPLHRSGAHPPQDENEDV